MKESFYKTDKEILLAQVVDRIHNDETNHREIHYIDIDEKLPITEEELVQIAMCEIPKPRTTLWTEHGYNIGSKRTNVIGKKRVTEIVEHRVKIQEIK